MSRKYKFHNQNGLYFVSFATVYWIDVFIREDYFSIIIESLTHCRNKKGMQLYSWCIMPSHIHLIFEARENNPGDLMRDFKTFTSKKLQKSIANNMKESRREWMSWMFKRAGSKNSNVQSGQFWQQNNHPIELWRPKVIDQKVEYIHQNPVVSGFVREPEDWKYSSAIDYCGGKGLIEIEFV